MIVDLRALTAADALMIYEGFFSALFDEIESGTPYLAAIKATAETCKDSLALPAGKFLLKRNPIDVMVVMKDFSNVIDKTADDLRNAWTI